MDFFWRNIGIGGVPGDDPAPETDDLAAETDDLADDLVMRAVRAAAGRPVVVGMASGEGWAWRG